MGQKNKDRKSVTTAQVEETISDGIHIEDNRPDTS
jgi:hypothetical protein